MHAKDIQMFESVDAGTLDLEQSNIQRRQTIQAKKASQDQPSQLRVVNIFPSGKKLVNLDKGRDKSDTFCKLLMKWHSEQT